MNPYVLIPFVVAIVGLVFLYIREVRVNRILKEHIELRDAEIEEIQQKLKNVITI